MAYTTIDDPSAHFQTKIYSGDGNDDRNITYDGNADMQPDWLWFKRRNQDVNHILFDSTRGVTKRNHSNNTNAEATEANFLQAFNSNGFQVGTDADINGSGGTYVSWGWKANGGTTTTNDASSTGVGSIDSVYQANTTAGFSIVTYTGNATSGATVAHGLGAVPHVIIVKCIGAGSTNWATYHHKNTSAPETDALEFNNTNATSDDVTQWNDTAPTSTVFSLGSGGDSNPSQTMVAYCFAEIQGYSKFGSYTGNGNADGPFVYTGFKPAWILVKRTDNTNGWFLMDNKRSPFNLTNDYLRPNASDAEGEAANSVWDTLSNGFKLRGTGADVNASGSPFIYLAFASSPLVGSDGTPCTAR